MLYKHDLDIYVSLLFGKQIRQVQTLISKLFYVLQGTIAVEGLSLKLSQSEKINFKAEAFHMMKRLRLLHLANVQLEGDYKYISRDLRWLCWHGFPKKYIPRNFHKQNLVAIDLKYSSLTQVWKTPLVCKYVLQLFALAS